MVFHLKSIFHLKNYHQKGYGIRILAALLEINAFWAKIFSKSVQVIGSFFFL